MVKDLVEMQLETAKLQAGVERERTNADVAIAKAETEQTKQFAWIFVGIFAIAAVVAIVLIIAGDAHDGAAVLQAILVAGLGTLAGVGLFGRSAARRRTEKQ